MTKRKIKRKTRSQRKSIDDIHYGPEPDVDYFDNHSIHDFLSWYNYMWDKKKSMRVLINYAKQFTYKNAPKFKKMIIPNALAYIATGLEKGLTFPAPNKAEKGETGISTNYDCCETPQVVMESGCETCKACGWSMCHVA